MKQQQSEQESCQHADLMIEYGKDGLTHPRPWELWEVSNNGDYWVKLEKNPNWEANYYRRKPRTITVNGIEVPKPMRIKPKKGAVYFIPHQYEEELYMEFDWDDDRNDNLWLERGLCHATAEAAIAHAKAMIANNSPATKNA